MVGMTSGQKLGAWIVSAFANAMMLGWWGRCDKSLLAGGAAEFMVVLNASTSNVTAVRLVVRCNVDERCCRKGVASGCKDDLVRYRGTRYLLRVGVRVVLISRCTCHWQGATKVTKLPGKSNLDVTCVKIV